MTKLVIRNSMLKDWETLCPLAFRARWFGTESEKKLMDIGYKQNIRWGSYFEQLIFGSGVGGKIITLTDKEIKSTHFERVKSQAKEARRILFKSKDSIPFIKAQVQVFGNLEIEGHKIPCEGNIDGMFGRNKIPELNVDTKYTADTSNEWGAYAWGKPEEMDMGQLVMYKELTLITFGVHVRSQYYVADSTPQERVEMLEPQFSSYYINHYKYRVAKAYTEISQALNFNYWMPKNSYAECKQCPLRNVCPSAILMPEIKIIEK